MPEKLSGDQNKIRVLISGALPPPIGGVGTYYESLLSSSLPEMVNLVFVQTSSHNRVLSQTGRATFTNMVFAAKDCGRFFQAVFSFRPRICHVGTAFGISFLKHSVCVVIARAFGSRVLLHPHCSLSALYSERSRLWQWYFRQIIRLTNGVIALSSEWKQVSEIVPKSQVYFLPNAIDLTTYRRIAQDRLMCPKQNSIVHILYLGYLGRAKGTFDLLDTAQRISQEVVGISFELVGSEHCPGELFQLYQDINIRKLSRVVKIHEPVFGVGKLACFRDADIFVYPSYSEGMPMAVIEAMASVLPIVATNVGGLPDLVRNGVNGILVEPGRSDQLATALLKIASNLKLGRSMQNESAQIALENYDIEQHVMRLLDVYAKNN